MQICHFTIPPRGRAALVFICSTAFCLHGVACVVGEKVSFPARPAAEKSGELWTGLSPVRLAGDRAMNRGDRAAVPIVADRATRRSDRTKVHAELFGPIEYGMTLDEIMQVLPEGRRVKVEYMDDRSVTLHWFTTMWGEFAKVHLQMTGTGQTLNAVIVVIDNCENTIVQPGGVSLSPECQKVTGRIARYLEERYGAPRRERETYAGGDGYLEKTIWISPTSEIYFVFTTSVEQNGLDRFGVSTAPLLVFEPQR